MNLIVRELLSLPSSQSIEIVERKGIGHPDTICDGIAEHVCVLLCRYYLDHFGFILHHNVDKVLLCGGAARASFGGGEILHPIEIYIAGRATQKYDGRLIPVDEIAEDACLEWLRLRVPTLDVERQVRVVSRIRSGSTDLLQLFNASTAAAAVSNDTSAGAGFAPMTDLENVVLEVERRLNSPETKAAHPGIGADVKIMGIRQGGRVHLTISCAMVSRFVPDLDAYVAQKQIVSRLALEVAEQNTQLPIDVVVNAADDLKNQNLFLTVTGSSAEAGDDGEAGRGNRASGLITPYRAMTMEATAGKNPVTHVGKLYNLIARRIACSIVKDVDAASNSQCVLVSQIGRPVADPQIADLALTYSRKTKPDVCRQQVSDIVHAELEQVDKLRADLLAERVSLF